MYSVPLQKHTHNDSGKVHKHEMNNVELTPLILSIVMIKDVQSFTNYTIISSNDKNVKLSPPI